jgi:hypothetical protein
VPTTLDANGTMVMSFSRPRTDKVPPVTMKVKLTPDQDNEVLNISSLFWMRLKSVLLLLHCGAAIGAFRDAQDQDGMFRSEALTACDGDFAVHSRPACRSFFHRPAKGLSADFVANTVVTPASAANLSSA